jgi:hypothetical protein
MEFVVAYRDHCAPIRPWTEQFAWKHICLTIRCIAIATLSIFSLLGDTTRHYTPLHEKRSLLLSNWWYSSWAEDEARNLGPEREKWLNERLNRMVAEREQKGDGSRAWCEREVFRCKVVRRLLRNRLRQRSRTNKVESRMWPNHGSSKTFFIRLFVRAVGPCPRYRKA